TLSAAEIFGLPIADPLAALQVMMASGVAVPAYIVSAAGVTLFYFLLGGRSFCSWVCPVYLVTELGDKVRERLQSGKRTVSLSFKQGLLLMTLVATMLTGLPFFETLSPVGMVGRAVAFGSWVGLASIAGVVVAEIFFARRVWCRSLCPLGAYYAIVGSSAPLKVRFEAQRCTGCGDCSRVCPVEEVLEPSLKSGAESVRSGECTRCGLCIDVCKPEALKATYSFSK
ncbi:MAG: NapH/MauN family ferredoxin-type protein, partial [Dehalococcoidia bacterium]